MHLNSDEIMIVLSTFSARGIATKLMVVVVVALAGVVVVLLLAVFWKLKKMLICLDCLKRNKKRFEKPRLPPIDILVITIMTVTKLSYPA